MQALERVVGRGEATDPGSATLASARRDLAASLASQGRYDEAVSVLAKVAAAPGAPKSSWTDLAQMMLTLKAVRKVASGRRYLTRSLAEKLAWRFSVGNEKDGHEALSDRELQVLCMLASGRRLSDVATELGLSIKTVSTYRARILTKMGLTTTAELIQYAIRNGLVQ